MRPLRCSACALHALGVGRVPAWGLALASPVLQHVSHRVPFRVWPLMKQRTRAAGQWLHGMSKVISLCQWGSDVMLRNGVTPNQLRMVRHGLAVAGRKPDAAPREDSREVVKLGFFGRLDPTKGLQVLMAALESEPDLKLELHCHLIRDRELKADMQAVASRLEADPRVRLQPPVAPDQVVDTMAGYDAVVVPSIWLETGPLVVLEAFAAGVPVLGSDLGGIAEWVTQDKDGMLVPAGDVAAWARAMARFCQDGDLRARLRTGVQAPPTMADVAVKMGEIYGEVLS